MPRARLPKTNQLFVWDYSKGGKPRKRMVGDFDLATGTWTKRRLDPKKHLAQIAGGAPAWDATIFESLGPDLYWLVAHTTDGRTFTTTRETFDKYGFEKNFGYGRQKFLEYKHWSVAQAGQMKLEEASI